MRFYLSIFFLCFIAVGCNSDPRCRRETALLRAEILDLEDKYFLLKSQRDTAIAELSADGKTELAQRIFPNQIFHDPALGGMIYSETVFGQGGYSDGEYYDDGLIYADRMAPGRSSITSQPYDYAPYQYSPNDTLPIEAEGAARDSLEDNIEIELDHRENIVPRESIQSVPATDLLPFPSSSRNKPGNRLLLQAAESNSPGSNSARSRRLAKSSSAKTGVTGIAINRDETRGHDVDGQPGDEGLNVLIQLELANGETIQETGELTVSIIDPDATSANQRIGLWKFLPDETALFFTKNPEKAQGIMLHLPWDQITPRGKQVVVFARFQTNDGRRLETSAPIRVTPRPSETPDAIPADGKQPLIANRTKTDSSVPTANNIRPSTPAIPASTGSSRISKPAWRPVR